MRSTLTLLFSLVLTSSFAQMQANFSKTVNTICNGGNCDYSGPTILINEIMASPSTYDGCLSGVGGTGGCRGEWIELYNPNLCQPVDISCYFLASNVYLSTTIPILGESVSNNSKEAFILPQGTIIPAGGFCLIRGENAAAVPANKLVANGGNVVEIVMPGEITGTGICVNNDNRFWFPNASGWFGFFDQNGVPQDAVEWGPIPANGKNIIIDCMPRITNCNNVVVNLGTFNNFPANRKTQILTTAIPDAWGKSFRRFPDGGNWEAVTNTSNYTATPSPGDCNGTCAQVQSSSCDGTATINVTGGTAPYTYVWNDSQAQLTQTATGLCEGNYTVRVTDANNNVQSFNVSIVNHIPTVTFSIIEQVCNEGQTITTTYSPTAAAGQTGTFSGNGMNGASFSVPTASNGTHPLTYTFTDQNGCTNNAKDTITVHPKPVPTISGIDATYCLSNQTIQPVLNPTGGTLTGPGVSNGTFSILGAGVGTHTIKYVVTNQFGCSDSTQINVTISGSTPPVFTIQDEICIDGNPIALAGTPTGGIFTLNGQQITQFNPATHGLGQHIIAYSITDPGNTACMSQAVDTINVVSSPTITANIPAHFCYQAANYAVDIQPAGGQLTGDLLNGSTLEIATANPGNYTIQYAYTNADGCSSNFTHNFRVGNPLNVNLTISQDCYQNVSLTATPTTGSFASSTWTYGGTTIATSPVTNYHVENSGASAFKFTGSDANGCSVSKDTIYFVNNGFSTELFVIPNVITPNNDGVNDFIQMPLMDQECFEYKVLILNRWGNIVFEGDKGNQIFYGNDKGGKKLADGVYFYKLISDDFDCEEGPFKPVCYGFITIVSK